MNLFVDMGLAWISVILAALLSIIYVLRISSRNKGKSGKIAGKLNKSLRKYHKYIGVLLILTGFIHGLFSTQKVLSFNLGTIVWVVSILLGISWMMRKYLGKLKGWIFYHRLLTVLLIGTLVWHIVDVGGIKVHKVLFGSVSPSHTASVDPSSLPNLESQLQGKQFKDGVYSGEATGFRPGLKVSVEIKDNKITDIQVTEHNEENARFYAEPVEQIPQRIISAQSTDVDTISGATYTSIGIINAVNNALSKALISGELPADKEVPQNSDRRGHHGGRDTFGELDDRQ
jgi:uncharacterized protein with FMN-binding domain